MSAVLWTPVGDTETLRDDDQVQVVVAWKGNPLNVGVGIPDDCLLAHLGDDTNLQVTGISRANFVFEIFNGQVTLTANMLDMQSVGLLRADVINAVNDANNDVSTLQQVSQITVTAVRRWSGQAGMGTADAGSGLSSWLGLDSLFGSQDSAFGWSTSVALVAIAILGVVAYSTFRRIEG